MRSIVRVDEELRRLMTIPVVGEVGAMAVHAFAPAMENFARGRDFAAWIGLTPRQGLTAKHWRPALLQLLLFIFLVSEDI